jgi:hypothetical protein
MFKTNGTEMLYINIVKVNLGHRGINQADFCNGSGSC